MAPSYPAETADNSYAVISGKKSPVLQNLLSSGEQVEIRPQRGRISLQQQLRPHWGRSDNDSPLGNHFGPVGHNLGRSNFWPVDQELLFPLYKKWCPSGTTFFTSHPAGRKLPSELNLCPSGTEVIFTSRPVGAGFPVSVSMLSRSQKHRHHRHGSSRTARKRPFWPSRVDP